MKKITFILFALISGTAFAQTATANASADIVSPITISHSATDSDLVFGKVIPAETATTIILDHSGAVDGTSTGTSVSSSTRTAAAFTIQATNTYSYSITLPSTSVNLTGPTGSTAMTVSDFTQNLLAANNVSDGNGDDLLVGGTLNVGANQPEGNYTGEFTVTVAYE